MSNNFQEWISTNTGEISLISMYATEVPFPAYTRLIAEVQGGVSLIGRICESGPEGRLVSLRDWIGGFRISFINHLGQTTSMTPIHSEKATLAVLRGFADDLSQQGYPCLITEFMPGGGKYNPNFNPLLPSNTKIGRDAPNKFLQIALEVSKNFKRVAPNAGMPDLEFEGFAVYDQRMPPETLEQISANAPQPIQPLMILVPTIGGPPHWLMADGILGEVTQTWMMGSLNKPSIDQWSTKEFRCQLAPDFISEKTQKNRMNLN